MGLIAMSERDLQRIEILSKVVERRMTIVAMAHVLALSPGRSADCWSGCKPTRCRHPAQGAQPALEQSHQRRAGLCLGDHSGALCRF